MSSRSSRTIYVGNLPGDIRMKEVEGLFLKYGPIVDIDLKIPPRPPGYAFVEYEDPRDANDAIYGQDGYDFDGFRLRVELAHGGRHSSSHRSSSYNRSSSSRGASRCSDYHVLVTELPPAIHQRQPQRRHRPRLQVLVAYVRHGVGREGECAMPEARWNQVHNQKMDTTALSVARKRLEESNQLLSNDNGGPAQEQELESFPNTSGS
ncbi:hypothetical protein TB1_010159 [Malus domestica]